MNEHAANPLSASTSLLNLIRDQNAEGWSRLVRLFGPLVYNWARRAQLQEFDAADVMQEVFLNVSRGIKNFRRENPSDTFRGWLWTITRNEINKWRARNDGNPSAKGGTDAHRQLHEHSDPYDVPSESSVIDERSNLLHRALELIRADFSEQTWHVFRRTVLLNESPAEVAADMDLNARTVRQAKYRVLCRLRSLLEGL